MAKTTTLILIMKVWNRFSELLQLIARIADFFLSWDEMKRKVKMSTTWRERIIKTLSQYACIHDSMWLKKFILMC